VHIIQAEGIRAVRTDLARPPQISSLGRASVRVLTVEIRLFRTERRPVMEWRTRTGPARILPFRFPRQSVQAPFTFPFRPFRELSAKCHGTSPRHALDGMLRTTLVAPLVTGGIHSHDHGVFALRHGVDVHPEGLTHLHGLAFPFVAAPLGFRSWRS